ncbi:MAG: universal stress protein [Bacteroidota bacterium]
MSSILVPIDFSENSLIVIKFAASLMDKRQGELILLHVSEPIGNLSANTQSIREHISENLGAEHLIQLWSNEVKGNCRTILKEGPVAETILKTAKEVNASMIVMGTKGAKSTLDRFIGSNASHVATNSEMPVLVIPESMPYLKISKIVIGVDPNIEYDQTLAWLSESLLQNTFDITLFSAGSPTIEDDMKHYQKRLTGIIHQHAPNCNVNEKVVTMVDTVASLDGFVKDLDADLLVLTTHHRGVFERIFDPGLTRKFTLASDIPILAIPMRKVPIYFFG